MLQLDSAVLTWRLMTMLEQGLLFKDKKSTLQDQRIWKMVKFESHRFVVRSDGWKLLCRDLHIDSDRILRQLPGHDNIGQMEEQARGLAFSAEEALRYLRELFERRSAPDEDPEVRHEYRLDTAADVARAMHEVLDEHLAAWR